MTSMLVENVGFILIYWIQLLHHAADQNKYAHTENQISFWNLKAIVREEFHTLSVTTQEMILHIISSTWHNRCAYISASMGHLHKLMLN